MISRNGQWSLSVLFWPLWPLWCSIVGVRPLQVCICVGTSISSQQTRSSYKRAGTPGREGGTAARIDHLLTLKAFGISERWRHWILHGKFPTRSRFFLPFRRNPIFDSTIASSHNHSMTTRCGSLCECASACGLCKYFSFHLNHVTLLLSSLLHLLAATE